MIFTCYTNCDDVPANIRAALDAVQVEWWDDLEMVVIAPGSALRAFTDEEDGRQHWEVENRQFYRVVSNARSSDDECFCKITVDGEELAVGLVWH